MAGDLDLNFGVEEASCHGDGSSVGALPGQPASESQASSGGASVGAEASFVLGGEEAAPGRLAEAASTGEQSASNRVELTPEALAAKRCVGCHCTAATPSVLCQKATRLWDHNDYSAQWCKHCASVGRLRFVGANNLASLAHLAVWVSQSPAQTRCFQLKVLAYFSLKTESQLTLVNGATLEQKVSVFERCMTWARLGHTLGLPPIGFCRRRVFREFHDFETQHGNPLMAEGSIIGGVLGGQRVLGVLAPEPANHPDRLSLKDVFDSASPARRGAVLERLGGLNVRVQSEQTAHALRTSVQECTDFLEVPTKWRCLRHGDRPLWR